jgi:peptidoglycan/xylan/chitin deacetylase (PgdA/CDA1 family)
MIAAVSGTTCSNAYGSQHSPKAVGSGQKVVILTFDDGYKSQYSGAIPILDKYGFKATFSIVCNYVGNGDNRMTWEEIRSLQQEGHDIASHTMNHDDLSKLAQKQVEFEVAQSKKCLLEQGINPKSFSYPFNGGSDDPFVINTVASHYDLARTATDPLAFLTCDEDTDCAINRYSIMGWSHDADRKSNAFNDQQMFERFIEVVNSQKNYNDNGMINALPILIWHRIENTNEEYATSIELFDAEMKYLYDNGFTVLTMADLTYDDTSNYLKISAGANDDVYIPNNENKNDRGAKINDADEVKDDDARTQEVTPTIKDYGSASEDEENKGELAEANHGLPQQDSDNRDDEEKQEEETQGELPSAILQFLYEP